MRLGSGLTNSCVNLCTRAPVSQSANMNTSSAYVLSPKHTCSGLIPWKPATKLDAYISNYIKWLRAWKFLKTRQLVTVRYTATASSDSQGQEVALINTLWDPTTCSDITCVHCFLYLWALFNFHGPQFLLHKLVKKSEITAEINWSNLLKCLGRL